MKENKNIYVINEIDSFWIFDFGIKVASEISVFWECVKIEVSEDVSCFFEDWVEVTKGQMLYCKNDNSV